MHCAQHRRAGTGHVRQEKGSQEWRCRQARGDPIPLEALEVPRIYSVTSLQLDSVAVNALSERPTPSSRIPAMGMKSATGRWPWAKIDPISEDLTAAETALGWTIQGTLASPACRFTSAMVWSGGIRRHVDFGASTVWRQRNCCFSSSPNAYLSTCNEFHTKYEVVKKVMMEKEGAEGPDSSSEQTPKQEPAKKIPTYISASWIQECKENITENATRGRQKNRSAKTASKEYGSDDEPERSIEGGDRKACSRESPAKGKTKINGTPQGHLAN